MAPITWAATSSIVVLVEQRDQRMSEQVKTSYLALNYRHPGEYIPQHDPSFTNESLEKAVVEARFDLDHNPDRTEMAIYKLVAVVPRGQEVVDVD